MNDQPDPHPRADPDPRTFYVVWSPQGGNPVARIPDFKQAKHAAWRLSEKHPGQDFFVLKSCWGRLARATSDSGPSHLPFSLEPTPDEADR